MNGSVLYGSHLSASLARFLGSLGYRKSKQVKNIVSNNGVSREDLSHPSQIDIVVEDLANGNKEACDGYRGRVCMEEQQSFFP
ncbi:hypothetical protein V6N13_117399 [Hibiscus sabdariffa]